MWTSQEGGLLDRWIQSPQARAVRDGTLWLLPYLMVWSVIGSLAEICRVSGWDHWTAHALASANTAMRSCMPLVMWGSIGSMLAVQWHLPRPAVAFVCVAAGLLAGQLTLAGSPALASLEMPLAIIGPLLLVTLMVRLLRLLDRIGVPACSAAGGNVSDVLRLILPAIVATLVFVTAVAGSLHVVSQVPASGLIDLLRQAPTSVVALLYCMLNSLLWSVGIHGYYALLPLLDLIPTEPVQQAALGKSLLGAFVFIGGSGGTASLVLALLLSCRDRKIQLLAMVSLVPACFNVNEPLLYGLPLIMNRHLFLPFVLVPMVNLAVLCLALEQGWLHSTGMGVPFHSPLLLNALMAAGDAQMAMALQVFSLLLGVAIYWPFVRRYERSLDSREHAGLRSLVTCYAQRREEASLMLDDPVAQGLAVQLDQQRLKDKLQAWDQGEFLLHFQPKVDPRTGRTTSCEALLRLDLGDGRLLGPGDFLEDLARAGLMKSVDHWVLVRVIEQMAEWRACAAPSVSVSVNVSVETLSDCQAMKAVVALIARCEGELIFEITEEALAQSEVQMRSAINAIRQAGAQVHLDDFGTGYSSLSYLHRFDIDGIKIDRSFTQSLDSGRGQTIFAALCKLAGELDLSLVIEGLEESWQLEHLPKNPKLTVQGWIYSAGLQPTDFTNFVHQGLVISGHGAPPAEFLESHDVHHHEITRPESDGRDCGNRPRDSDAPHRATPTAVAVAMETGG